VPRLCVLSHWLWAVDGPRPRALFGVVARSQLYALTDQHSSLRRRWREQHLVPGPAAVGLLLAASAVDQGSAGHLPAALGIAGDAGLYFIPLDADWRAGSRERLATGALWHRWPDLVQSPGARAWIEYYRLHVEMDAVLDRGLSRRPDGDSPGHQ